MPSKLTDPGPLLNHQEAADRLGVSVVTVRRLRYAGDLPTVKVRGAVRIPLRAVQAYVAAQTTAGAA